MDGVSDFFNSDLGKQLTNIGTTWATNQLGLTSSGSKNNAVVQPVQQVVQTVPQAGGMDKQTMYWIIGGVAVVGVALIFIMRK